jgi:hypothetical protein
MTATTVGREPVQLVEIRQPLCGNTFGTAPCTATGTGATKCYNTRATCQDAANYRHHPAGHLTYDRGYDEADTLTATDFARTADFLFALKARIPSGGAGVLWHLGDATTGAYLGITSGGNIVFRAGDGGTGTPTNCAKLDTSASAILGKTVVLFGAIDVSANSVTLWSWDETLREVSEIGTATAAGSFATWAGAVDGAVGTNGGTVPTGENGDDFSGDVLHFHAYDSTAAPDMTASFVLPLYFSRGHIADRVPGVPYIIPSLESVSTAPTRINLSSANRDAKGLGNRALASIRFADHPHTDRRVDPYVDGRGFDPMTRGTFWSKWMVRNLYRNNMLLRVYEGYAGQTLSQMTERRFFLTGTRGPDDGGGVTIEAKDILAKLEERKAQAPEASPGELYADITDSQTSIEVANAVTTDYPASGTLRIDDELMTYSSVATSTFGITFTITARGTDNTTAATHDAETKVQECLRFTDQPVANVARTLLRDWGEIDEAWLDFANWEAEAENYLQAYRLTTVITEPTEVAELVSEIQEQVGFYLWWDERAALVKFRAIRGVDTEPELLTAESNIMRGMSIEELPRQRVSQVWLYYGIRDYTGSIEEPGNYDRASLIATTEAESAEQYGEPSIRKIYSRWLHTAALADTTASKIATRYEDSPRQASFTMDAKDRGYWVGDTLRISHPLDVDEYGERRTRYWTIISAEEVQPGEVVRYVAEDTTLYSNIYYILPSGAADYSAPADFGAAFIGDADGLLSDGTTCARIA